MEFLKNATAVFGVPGHSNTRKSVLKNYINTLFNRFEIKKCIL